MGVAKIDSISKYFNTDVAVVDSQLGPFCVEFACSPPVCVASLRVLGLPSTTLKPAC